MRCQIRWESIRRKPGKIAHKNIEKQRMPGDLNQTVNWITFLLDPDLKMACSAIPTYFTLNDGETSKAHKFRWLIITICFVPYFSTVMGFSSKTVQSMFGSGLMCRSFREH